MSKQPLSLPSSLFIFKKLTASGFWLSQWYEKSTPEARSEMAQDLIRLFEEGKLQAPMSETIEMGGSDEELGEQARNAVTQSLKGGRKILLRFKDHS